MPPKKKLADILRAVDPNLNIIEGGTRFHRTEPKPATVYTVPPPQMPEDRWDRAAGVICKQCGREVYQSRDGLCMRCWEKANEFEIRDTCGICEIMPLSTIMAIVHPAKREETSD